MEKQEFCCPEAAARAIKRITLQDGFQVGIINLDNIIKEVTELNLADIEALKRELIERVKTYNYVAHSAEYDYSTALLRAYRQQTDKSR